MLELDDDELDPSAYKGLKKAEIKKIQKERERKAKREAKEEEKKKAAERRRARGESGWRLGRGARAGWRWRPSPLAGHSESRARHGLLVAQLVRVFAPAPIRHIVFAADVRPGPHRISGRREHRLADALGVSEAVSTGF